MVWSSRAVAGSTAGGAAARDASTHTPAATSAADAARVAPMPHLPGIPLTPDPLPRSGAREGYARRTD